MGRRRMGEAEDGEAEITINNPLHPLQLLIVKQLNFNLKDVDEIRIEYKLKSTAKVYTQLTINKIELLYEILSLKK